MVGTTEYVDAVTMKDLKGVKFEEPEGAGCRWRLIPHYDLLEQISLELRHRGYTVTARRAVLSPQTRNMAAYVAYTGRTRYALWAGVQHAVGVVHSNNRRKRTALYPGAVWDGGGFVCDHFPLGTYEEIGASLEKIVAEAMEPYDDAVPRVFELMHHLRAETISKEQGTLFIVDLGRRKVMSWRAVGWAIRDFDKAIKERGQRGRLTLLDAYKPAAHYAVQTGALDQLDVLLRVTNICMKRFKPPVTKEG